MPKRKIESSSLDLVHIIWEDAWQSNSFWTRDELAKRSPHLLHHVGFLVYEDKENIVLCSEENPKQDAWRFIHSTPKCLIRGREIVKRGKQRG